MNIGDLTATLGVDTSGLSKAVQEWEKFNKQNQDATYKTSDGTKKVNDTLIVQKGIIEKLEEKLKSLKEGRTWETTTEDVAKYNQKIKETEIELQKVNQLGVESKQNLSFGDIVGKYTGGLETVLKGAGAIAAVAVTVEAAKKAWEAYGNVMKSTGGTTLEFEKTSTMLKFSLDEINRSVATGGFKGLADRIKEAGKNGRELAEQLEYVFNLSLRLKLVTADYDLQMAQQALIYRNTTLDVHTRYAAVLKYIELIDKKEAETLSLGREQIKLAMDASSVKASHLDESQIRWYINNTSAIKENEKEVEHYIQLQKDLDYQLRLPKKSTGSERGTIIQNPEEITRLKTEIDGTDRSIKNIAVDYKSWLMITKEEREALIASLANMKEIQAHAAQEKARPSRSVAGIWRELGMENEAAKNLKVTYQNLYFTQAEGIRLAKTSPYLNKMPNFRENLILLATASSATEEVNNQLNRIAATDKIFGQTTNITADQVKYLESEMRKLIDAGVMDGAKFKALKEAFDKLNVTTKDSIKEWKDWKDVTNEITRGFQDLSNTIGGNMFSSLGKVSGGVNSIMNSYIQLDKIQSSTTMDSTQKLLGSLGVYGQIASAVIGIGKAWLSWGWETGQTLDQIKQVNIALIEEIDYQQRINALNADTAAITSPAHSQAELDAKIASINANEILDLDAANKDIVRADEYSAKVKNIQAKAIVDTKKLYDEFDQWKEDQRVKEATKVAESENAYYEKQAARNKKLADDAKKLADDRIAFAAQQKAMAEAITGTTSTTLADSIRKGLQEGLSYAQTFGNSFSEIIRNSIINSLILKMIEPKLQKMVNDIGGAFANPQTDPATIFASMFKEYGVGSKFQNDLNGTYSTISKLLDGLGIGVRGVLNSMGNEDYGHFLNRIGQGKGITSAGGTAVGASASAVGGLQGAMKGMSEETAGLIAGQFAGLRISSINIEKNTLPIAEIRDLLKKGVSTNKTITDMRGNGLPMDKQ